MKVHTASLINAILLIVLSGWGYMSSGTPSITALIPLFVGVILLLLYRGIKREDKLISHMAVVLTLLILIGLIKPLMGAIERGNSMPIFRVGIMIVSTLVAMFFFVKNFIDVRKERAKKQAKYTQNT